MFCADCAKQYLTDFHETWWKGVAWAKGQALLLDWIWGHGMDAQI